MVGYTEVEIPEYNTNPLDESKLCDPVRHAESKLLQLILRQRRELIASLDSPFKGHHNRKFAMTKFQPATIGLRHVSLLIMRSLP